MSLQSDGKKGMEKLSGKDVGPRSDAASVMNREFLQKWRSFVVENEGDLRGTPESVRSNRDIVLLAVGQDGGALRYASEKLRSDREIVRPAVACCGWALRWATERLRTDREIVMTAILSDGWALQWASEALRSDRELVMAAVSQAGNALQWASDALRNDGELVMRAVAQAGNALRWASPRLCNELTTVVAAVAQSKSVDVANLASSRLSMDAAFLQACQAQLSEQEVYLARFSLLSGRSTGVVLVDCACLDDCEIRSACARRLDIETEQSADAKLVFGLTELPREVAKWRMFLVEGQLNDISLVLC